MFRLEMLPAGPGDCLWIEYGSADDPHIIIIDGGVSATFAALEERIGQAIEERGASPLHIELMVVTHLDNDHIQGILKLLNESQHPITFGDIWFNGNRQLLDLTIRLADEEESDGLGGKATDILGFNEADDLSTLLAERDLPWNEEFDGSAVMVLPDGELPWRELAGDLKLTVLGPTLTRLHELGQKWPSVLEAYKNQELTGVAERPGDSLGKKDTWPPKWDDHISSDDSEPNGSSIVLLIEYNDKAYLLPGDAFAPDIVQNLNRLMAERGLAGRFPLAALKLSHHGSVRNISRPFIEKVACNNYLISTDGSGSPRHPDHQAILRVLKYSFLQPRLVFNYDAPTTYRWGKDTADVPRLGHGIYGTKYPKSNSRGLILQWDIE